MICLGAVMKQSGRGFVGIFSFLPVFLFVLVVLVGSSISTTARAENAIYEKWQVYMGGTTCNITLRRWQSALKGYFDSAGNCPNTLRAVKFFTFTDQSRQNIVLFADGQMRTMIGNASVNSTGNLEGMIGDGEMLTLRYLSYSSKAFSQGQQGQVQGSNQTNTNCRRYPNNNACARANDDRVLAISGFNSVYRRTMSNQEAYAFSKQRGFANSQRVQQGVCVQVTRCEWDDAKLINWCEVRYNNDMMSGYIRQRDVNYVYLAEGC